MPDDKHTFEVHHEDIENIEYIRDFLQRIDKLMVAQPGELRTLHRQAKESADRLWDLITSA